MLVNFPILFLVYLLKPANVSPAVLVRLDNAKVRQSIHQFLTWHHSSYYWLLKQSAISFYTVLFHADFSGHFGYIELPTPIYHPDHVGELKRMLSLLCLKCLKLKNRKVLYSMTYFCLLVYVKTISSKV